MVRLRSAGILALVVLIALLAAGGAADAKKKKKKKRSWKTSVTLTSASSIPQFSGTVGSKLKACIGARVVNVFYTDPAGNLQTVPLAVDRTNKKGYFAVYLPAAPYSGTYQVTVDTQKIRAKKRPQQCKGTTSASVTV